MQGPESVYYQQLLFNWRNTFWGANLKLALLQVCFAFTRAVCGTRQNIDQLLGLAEDCWIVLKLAGASNISTPTPQRAHAPWIASCRGLQNTTRQCNAGMICTPCASVGEQLTSVPVAGRGSLPPTNAVLSQVLAVRYGRRPDPVHAAGPCMERQRWRAGHNRQCGLPVCAVRPECNVSMCLLDKLPWLWTMKTS